jgi:hypothetical protein
MRMLGSGAAAAQEEAATTASAMKARDAIGAVGGGQRRDGRYVGGSRANLLASCNK